MSISFNDPVNNDVIRQMATKLGEPVAHDRKTFLYDDLPEIHRQEMSALARTAGQPLQVQFHSIGDVHEMSDGTRYEAVHGGWKKVSEPSEQ